MPADPSEVVRMGGNTLRRYLYQQAPEDLAQIAQTISPDVQQMIAMNVQGLLGGLPSEQFEVQVTTHRDNLAGLLASAMMTGYFLRRVEQRMELEHQLFPVSPEVVQE
ncbi:DUF760 domain-containing protein [Anthocerotibacter panamensis]|uniref:DUF760 domain-containing protein n=1 Tax=Anthocerotibacter panamensis TaxID=2857077 RepID=UPI0036F291CD